MEEVKTTHKLSIFLIKEGTDKYQDILKGGSALREYNLRNEINISGKLFLGETKTSNSNWRELLNEGTSSNLPNLENSSNRAVLFIKVQRRIFALPFGYGKNLIKEEMIER